MSVTSPAIRGGKYATLQGLRGITALAVVIGHLDFLFAPDGTAFDVVSSFYLGVDVFFVISGFVIAMATVDRVATTPSAFLVRRVFRIVPLVWAVVLMVTMLLHHPDHGLVLRGLLLLPENPSHFVMPLVYPNWTLSYELFFYLLFGAALLVSHAYRCEICLVLIGILTLADAVVPKSPGAFRSFLDSSLLLEFAAGLVIARIIMHAPRIGRPGAFVGFGMALIGVGAVLCVVRPFDSGFFKFGCGAAVMIAGLLVIETYRPLRIPRWLQTLGDWSYAIYITQVFAIFVVEPSLKGSWLAGHLPGPAQLAVYLPTTIAMAAILHYGIEKPGIRLGRFLADRVGRRDVTGTRRFGSAATRAAPAVTSEPMTA